MSSYPDPNIIGDHYVALSRSQFRNFEGRILTNIESWGMPKTQEDSVKSLMRDEIWSLFNHGFAWAGLDKAMNPTSGVPYNTRASKDGKTIIGKPVK